MPSFKVTIYYRTGARETFRHFDCRGEALRWARSNMANGDRCAVGSDDASLGRLYEKSRGLMLLAA